MPLFHVQNNALSKPRNCPHCGQLCVNRRNKSAGSFSCYTSNRWVHSRFWGKTCSNSRHRLSHTGPTRPEGSCLWARGDATPPPFARHSGSHGQTGVIFSSLCPSALGPSKVGVGVSPQKAFGCQWQAKRSACPAERQEISARILCRQHT